MKTNFQSLNMGWGLGKQRWEGWGGHPEQGLRTPPGVSAMKEGGGDPSVPPNPRSGHPDWGINNLYVSGGQGGCAEVREATGGAGGRGTPPSLVSALRKEGGEPGTILTSTHSGQSI